jgi:acetate---CoA ligase (ADP-forming)
VLVFVLQGKPVKVLRLSFKQAESTGKGEKNYLRAIHFCEGIKGPSKRIISGGVMKTRIEYPDLEAMLRPRSVAVAWASADVTKLGGLALKYLLDFGFKGEIFPINAKSDDIQGLKCYASIKDIPQDIDCALLVMRAGDTPSMLRECVEKGVKAAVVPVIGFREVGGKGKDVEEEIAQICRTSGLKICGPNTNGLLNLVDGVALGYSPAMERVMRGRLGFVTQSGALISGLAPRFADNGIGLSHFIAAGNQVNVDLLDYVKYLIDDPDVDVIAMYIEGITDADKFLDVAEAALDVRKPLVVMKIGRTELAAKTALSHTASLVGSDKVFDSICKQEGIIRVDDFDELVSVCGAFLKCKLPSGNRVGVLSTSGAATGIIADAAVGTNLRFPQLSETTRQEASKILPGWPGSGEMVNLWDIAAALPGRMGDLSEPTVKLFAQDENSDSVLVIFSGVERASAIAVSSAVVNASKVVDKPFFLLHVRGSLRDFEEDIFAGSSIPVSYSASDVVKAIEALVKYSESLKRRDEREDLGPEISVNVEEIKGRLSSAGKTLTEHESKKLLSRYGIPVTREAIAQSPEEAVRIADQIGYPVALKVVSPQITHKTDAGAIKLDVSSKAELVTAYREVVANARKYDPRAEIDGVLIQEMLKGAREVIIGVSRDPQFGPSIVFGLGGVAVEVLEDICLRVAPITTTDAEEMIRGVKAYRMLEPFRGKPEADTVGIVETLLRVSKLAKDLEEVVVDIDINPLMVFDKGEGVKVADALVVLADSKVS